MGSDESGSFQQIDLTLDHDDEYSHLNEDDEQIDVDNKATSGQNDPDSLKTHVTETQFSQLREIELEELTGLRSDAISDAQPDELVEQEVGQTKRRPSPPVSIQPPVPRYVGRAELSTEPTTSFTFGQAPKAIVDYGRRIGQRNVGMSGAESLKHDVTRSGRNPTMVGDTKFTQPKLSEQAIRSTPTEKKDILPNLLQKLVAVAVTRTDLPIQGSHIDSYRKVEQPIATFDNSNRTAEQIVKPSYHDTEQQTKDVLPLHRTILEVPPTQQTIASGCHSGGHAVAPKRTEHRKAPSVRGSSHPAVRNASPQTGPVGEISHNQAKVTKSRRRPKSFRTPHPGLVSRAQTTATADDPIPSEEDLLTILLFRTQQEKRARDAEKAHLHAREAEHHRTRQALALLRSQIEQVSQRERLKEAELVKYGKVLPGLKEKAKKLEDFLKGLTNDHHKLRDDSIMLRRQQQSLQEDKVDIFTCIEEAREAIGRHPTGVQSVLAEARHHVDILEQKNEAYALQAGRDAELLQAEQVRNQRLEQELSKVTTSQHQIIELLQSHRADLMDKLNETLLCSATGNAVSDDERNHVNDMLNQCITLLEEVKGIQNVKPEDLEKLDESVKGYAQYLNVTLQHVSKASESARVEQRKLKHYFQKQIDMLKASVKTEQSLSDQVVDLREVRATVKERLQASEAALAESRHTLVGLQNMEKQLNQEISSLRGEILALHARPSEEPDVILRLREAESRNTELEANIARMLGDSSEHTDQVKRLDERAVIMQSQIDELTSQLEATRLQTQRLEMEKSNCEKQANMKYEGLKSQLLEATNAERAILLKEQSVASEKLRRQKALADVKVKTLEEEAGRLKVDKEVESQKRAQLQVDSQLLQGQKEAVDKELGAAQEKLQTIQEDHLGQIRSLEEDNVNLDRMLVEADARFSLIQSEMKSKTEEQLTRINAACQTYKMQTEAQVSLDSAIDLLLGLVKPVQRPQTPMLDDMSSQEMCQSQTIPKPNAAGNVDQSESLQTQKHTPDAAFPSWAKRSSLRPITKAQGNDAKGRNSTRRETTDSRVIRKPRQEIVIQESQTEETTIRRSHKTTKSTRTQNNTRNFTDTPTKQAGEAIEDYGESLTLTPKYPAALLEPPTPLQLTQAKGAANTESRSGAAGPVANGKKRTAEDFGFTPREEARKKSCYIDRQPLGPIIPDSQSPSRGTSVHTEGKARKRQGTSKGDKFTRRFTEFGG
ncbi:hypothetical protein MMC13_006442 [Lambiella insularis]|nr:hypothetical protein [Lambiella insularis]